MAPANQACFLLHRRNYRETSLLLDVFSRDHGILRLLAKGAMRGRVGKSSILQAFAPLNLSWTARGELPILTAAEATDKAFSLRGSALFCGFYLNELLLHLLPEYDPHPGIFAIYTEALHRLQTGIALDANLRFFELALLDELGYGLLLDYDADSGAAIQPECHYWYQIEYGPVLADPSEQTVRGATLLGLRNADLSGRLENTEAKRLMRRIISHYLGGKPLKSRELFKTARPFPVTRE
jgi:DNA repair protein RecO (recombination protein O)